MKKWLTKHVTEMSIVPFQASRDEIEAQIYKRDWQTDENKRETLLLLLSRYLVCMEADKNVAMTNSMTSWMLEPQWEADFHIDIIILE